jgi:hypothetical protein
LQAREAAGHRYRTSFFKAAGISKRSLEAVESLEPDAASVGETVLHAIGRALPTWTEDTPRLILEGGPIPSNEPVLDKQDQGSELAPLDEVLTATTAELAKLARMYAWYEGRRRGDGVSRQEDEDKFLFWAVDLRRRHKQGGISPGQPSNRDVS